MARAATKPPEGRGSGRTHRAVAALPDGGTYVVLHTGMRPYIRAMLGAQGRSPMALKLVLSDEPERLAGLRRDQVAVDHNVWEQASERERHALNHVLGNLR